jgi:DNA-binding LytR/AlgR family response regulator
MPQYQRIINCAALLILFVLLWLALGCGIDFMLFDEQTAIFFLKLSFVYALFGLLLYFVVMQQITIKILLEQREIKENEMFEISGKIHENIEPLERITVKTGSKIHVLSVDEIFCITADGDYVLLHTANGKHMKEQTMKYFMRHLPLTKFVRVHRSCIVNTDKISRIELLEKQTYYLILKNEQKIKMSIAGYKFLREKLAL